MIPNFLSGEYILGYAAIHGQQGSSEIMQMEGLCPFSESDFVSQASDGKGILAFWKNAEDALASAHEVQRAFNGQGERSPVRICLVFFAVDLSNRIQVARRIVWARRVAETIAAMTEAGAEVLVTDGVLANTLLAVA